MMKMKLSRAAIACLLLAPSCSPFTQQSPLLRPRSTNRFGIRTTTTTTTTTTTVSASGDDDDFYADFDPSQYENQLQDSGDGFYEERGPSSYNNNNNNNYNSNNRGRRNYGQDGQPHDYTRDTSQDQSNVDVAAVDAMISERLQCRRRRDFDRADSLRDELLEQHGVRIHDGSQTWRSGCSSSGSGSRWNGNDGRGGRDGRFGNRRDNNNRRGRRPDRDFGPLGHDYSPSPDAGAIQSPLEEAQIHQLLAQRLQAKLSRDFRTADALQQELVDNGILVHDGMKQWRADGQSFFENDVRSNGKLQTNRNAVPQQSQYSEEVANEAELQDISALLAERAKYRQSRLYDQADAIVEQLADRYQVQIDDRRQEWSRGGDFGPARQSNNNNNRRQQVDPFRQAQNSQPLTDEEAQKVQELVQRRDAARAARDFDTADKIRNALFTKDIAIHDKLRQWSVGGVFDRDQEYSSYDNNHQPQQQQRDSQEFTRRGGGSSLTEEQVEKIQDLLKQRQEYQRRRNFDAADDIRQELRLDYEVQVDDRNKEWHVATEGYVPAAGTATPQLEEIQQLVDQRLQAKLAKDYDTADALRDQLTAEYNVNIDDRVREWSIVGGNDGFANSHVQVENPMVNEEEGNMDDDDDEDDDIDETLMEVFDSGNDGEDDDDDDEDDTVDETLMEAEDNNQDDDHQGDGILPALDEEMLAKLTVPELKDRLRAANLPVSGKKAELIERLLN